jgi:hypothetical protein
MTLSSFVPLAERIWEHGAKQKEVSKTAARQGGGRVAARPWSFPLGGVFTDCVWDADAQRWERKQ